MHFLYVGTLIFNHLTQPFFLKQEINNTCKKCQNQQKHKHKINNNYKKIFKKKIPCLDKCHIDLQAFILYWNFFTKPNIFKNLFKSHKHKLALEMESSHTRIENKFDKVVSNLHCQIL
jgi:hypothetical protein